MTTGANGLSGENLESVLKELQGVPLTVVEVHMGMLSLFYHDDFATILNTGSVPRGISQEPLFPFIPP